jgi:hypothetical protein
LILAILGAACVPTPVEPPGQDVMPRGEWVYVKGESEVQCDGEDPYHSDLEWVQVTVDDVGERGIALGDSHLRELDCPGLGHAFYDASDATATESACGSRVLDAQSWLQLVSARVLYLHRSYEAVNPYNEFDTVRCRIFETGYLRPFVDVVEWDDADLDGRSDQ